MRHLLVISHFFPPMGGGGVQRITKFVKHLEACGWRSTILCGRAEDYWMRDDTLLDEIPEHARIVRTRAASGLGLLRRLGRPVRSDRRSARGFGMMRRASAWFLVPDPYVGWLPFGLRAARKILAEDPPAALLSTGPPETNHLVGLWLRRRTGIPWLVDFRDPWFGLHLRPAPTAWHRFCHARLEKSVLRHASGVTATTSWLRDLLRKRSPVSPEHLVVIRNGYDRDDFGTVNGPERAADTPLRLVHTGMLTLSRSAEGLLRGLWQLLQQAPELRGAIEVDLVGARESSNDELVRVLGLEDCVRLRGYVGHADAITAMQEADVLVLIKHTDPRFEGLIPGKLYEYMGARRPILALVPDSEAARLVRDLDWGRVVSPHDVDGIAEALGTFLENKRVGRLRDAYAMRGGERFERKAQAENLAALLEQIAPRSTSSGTRTMGTLV